MASPIEIEIAMHYWTSPGDYRNGDLSAPAVASIMARFVDMGLLVESKKEGQKYERTDGLKVWVNALCGVPFPIRIWTMPWGPI